MPFLLGSPLEGELNSHPGRKGQCTLLHSLLSTCVAGTLDDLQASNLFELDCFFTCCSAGALFEHVLM